MFKQISHPPQNTGGMTIKLTSLNSHQFLALADSDTELPLEIHDQFLHFLHHTELISAYHKKSMFHSLLNRRTCPSDIAFFDLERRYPFCANTDNVVKPDIPFPDMSMDDILSTFEFYMAYNSKTKDDHLFQTAFPEIFRGKFSPEAQLVPQTLILWFEEMTKSGVMGPFFKPHLQKFRSTLDSLHYPVEIQDTGDQIYVGQSPQFDPDYFWTTILALQKQTGTAPPAIHILNLEEKNKTQPAFTRHLERRDSTSSESDSTADQYPPYYWEANAGKIWDLESVTLTTTAIIRNPLDKQIKTYKINIQQPGNPKTEATLTHIECWPDGNIPDERHDPAILNTMMSLAKELLYENAMLYIHCKAGLGRTGVVRMALTYAMRALREEARISPGILLESYRATTRYGVQTPDQFNYLRTLCQGIDELCGDGELVTNLL